MAKISGDRLEAILIINGTAYKSDIDHQECLQDFYRKTGTPSPYKWDCGSKEFDNEHEEATHQTFDMKQTHKAYGFDLFDADGLGWVLVAHDKETIDHNRKWAMNYCAGNKSKLAYFTEGWDAEIVPFDTGCYGSGSWACLNVCKNCV